MKVDVDTYVTVDFRLRTKAFEKLQSWLVEEGGENRFYNVDWVELVSATKVRTPQVSEEPVEEYEVRLGFDVKKGLSIAKLGWDHIWNFMSTHALFTNLIHNRQVSVKFSISNPSRAGSLLVYDSIYFQMTYHARRMDVYRKPYETIFELGLQSKESLSILGQVLEIVAV